MSAKKIALAIVGAVVLIGCAVFGFYDVRVARESKQDYEMSDPVQITQALARNPNDPVALRSMGQICIRRNNFGDAIQNYQKSLQFDPSNRFTQFQLGYLFVHEHQNNQAISILTPLAADNDAIGQVSQKLLRKAQRDSAANNTSRG